MSLQSDLSLKDPKKPEVKANNNGQLQIQEKLSINPLDESSVIMIRDTEEEQALKNGGSKFITSIPHDPNNQSYKKFR
jgi:hypothetical protein